MMHCPECGIVQDAAYSAAPARCGFCGAWLTRTYTFGEYPRPSISPGLRRRVFERDGGCCRYCHTPLVLRAMHIDHATPWSRGGTSTLDNLVTSCADCNAAKRDRTAEEFALLGSPA
jgi:5-methylcytosine-specific restriction endonuclease McrA